MNDMTRQLLPYLLLDLEVDDLAFITELLSAYEGKQNDRIMKVVALKLGPFAAPLRDRRGQELLSVPQELEQI